MGCTLSVEVEFPARRKRHRRHKRRHHIPIYSTTHPDGFLEAVLGPGPGVCRQTIHGGRQTTPHCGTVTHPQQAMSHELDILKPRVDEKAKTVDAEEPAPPKTVSDDTQDLASSRRIMLRRRRRPKQTRDTRPQKLRSMALTILLAPVSPEIYYPVYIYKHNAHIAQHATVRSAAKLRCVLDMPSKHYSHRWGKLPQHGTHPSQGTWLGYLKGLSSSFSVPRPTGVLLAKHSR